MTDGEFTKAIEAVLRERGCPDLILPDKLGPGVAKTWGNKDWRINKCRKNWPALVAFGRGDLLRNGRS